MIGDQKQKSQLSVKSFEEIGESLSQVESVFEEQKKEVNEFQKNRANYSK